MKWEEHTPEEQQQIINSINEFLNEESAKELLEDIKNSEKTLEILRDYSKFKISQTCLHDKCPLCYGTNKKYDETQCIHMISCPCPKCSPQNY